MAQPKPPLAPDLNSHPLAALEGTVERLTFADPESHYAVVRLRVRGRRQPATVVGPLAAVKEGEQLHLKGRYEVHPKWGEQFRVVWWYAVSRPRWPASKNTSLRGHQGHRPGTGPAPGG